MNLFFTPAGRRKHTFRERIVEILLVPYLMLGTWLERRQYWAGQIIKCRKGEHLFNRCTGFCMDCGAECPWGKGW